MNYKNSIVPKKEAAGYLQTIESEEVFATEGCNHNDAMSINPKPLMHPSSSLHLSNSLLS